MLAQDAPKTPSKQPKTPPTRPQDTPIRYRRYRLLHQLRVELTRYIEGTFFSNWCCYAHQSLHSSIQVLRFQADWFGHVLLRCCCSHGLSIFCTFCCIHRCRSLHPFWKQNLRMQNEVKREIEFQCLLMIWNYFRELLLSKMTVKDTYMFIITFYGWHYV